MKLNLSDIYVQRFDRPKFETKQALKNYYVVLIVLLYKLVRCKAFLVSISLSTVLEMNFFSNRCFA